MILLLLHPLMVCIVASIFTQMNITQFAPISCFFSGHNIFVCASNAIYTSLPFWHPCVYLHGVHLVQWGQHFDLAGICTSSQKNLQLDHVPLQVGSLYDCTYFWWSFLISLHTIYMYSQCMHE